MDVTAWTERKNAQWQRIQDAMPGLQLLRARQQTQFMLVCSSAMFYEAVLIGQLPISHFKAHGSRLNPRRRPAEDHEKPHNKRGVDLDDEQIDEVLARWRQMRTALSLPFVGAVWDRKGRMQPQPLRAS